MDKTKTVKSLLILLLLLLATPAMAMDPEVDCTIGGLGLYEQSL